MQIKDLIDCDTIRNLIYRFKIDSWDHKMVLPVNLKYLTLSGNQARKFSLKNLT